MNLKNFILISLIFGFLIICAPLVNAQSCNWIYKTPEDYKNLITCIFDETIEECTWAPFLDTYTVELHKDYLTRIDGCTYFRYPYILVFVNVTIDEWNNHNLSLRDLKNYVITHPSRGAITYQSFTEMYFCKYEYYPPGETIYYISLPFPTDELNYVIDSDQLTNYTNYTVYFDNETNLTEIHNKTCRKIELGSKGWYRCYNLSYDGDKYEYCTSWPEEGWEEKVEASVILIMGNFTKPKMLETISESYFNEHFDLKRVLVPSTHFIVFEFIYSIGNYNLAYNVHFEEDYFGNVSFSMFQPPREIENVVDKIFVEQKAQECIGNKDIDYEIIDYRNYNLTPEQIQTFSPVTGFELVAIGYEIPTVTQPTMNAFAMNLETGEFICLTLPNTYYHTAGAPFGVKSEDLPNFIILIVGIIMVILALILISLWKFKS
jgi:hypothetical protein